MGPKNKNRVISWQAQLRFKLSLSNTPTSGSGCAISTKVLVRDVIQSGNRAIRREIVLLRVMVEYIKLTIITCRIGVGHLRRAAIMPLKSFNHKSKKATLILLVSLSFARL